MSLHCIKKKKNSESVKNMTHLPLSGSEQLSANTQIFRTLLIEHNIQLSTGKEVITDLPPLTLGLCPDKPISVENTISQKCI